MEPPNEERLAKKTLWAKVSPYVYTGLLFVGILNFYQNWTNTNTIRRENDLILRENDKLDHNDRERQAYQMLGLKGAAEDNKKTGEQIHTALLAEREKGAKYREICKRRGIALPPDLAQEKELAEFPAFVKVSDILIKFGDPNYQPPEEQ